MRSCFLSFQQAFSWATISLAFLSFCRLFALISSRRSFSSCCFCYSSVLGWGGVRSTYGETSPIWLEVLVSFKCEKLLFKLAAPLFFWREKFVEEEGEPLNWVTVVDVRKVWLELPRMAAAARRGVTLAAPPPFKLLN